MSYITMDQVSELLAQAKAGRVSREHLQAFLRNPDRVLEMTNSRSFQELLEACHQLEVWDDFNELNFPLERRTPDEEKWTVGLYHFDEIMTAHEGLKCLRQLEKKRKIRMLRGPRRAMEWIAAHQYEQFGYQIILPVPALGQMDMGACLPVFDKHMNIRGQGISGQGVRISYSSESFNHYCRWLVLYKK